MNRTFRWLVVILLTMGLLLTGCGTVTQESVLQKLQNIQNKPKPYKSKAMMTVQIASTVPRKFYVETWFYSPSVYRIALGNEQREMTQVIVRNEQGIYVIQPQLKKAFRFQGDWAENQGSIYLYHPLIQQILQSSERKFQRQREEGTVSFDLPMQPENPLVVRQKIVLGEKDLYPRQIDLYDKEDRPVVSIQYESFQENVKFDESDFSPEKDMAMNRQESLTAQGKDDNLGTIEPSYIPSGFTYKDTFSQEGRVWLRYVGDHGAVTLQERRSRPGRETLVGVTQLWTLYTTPIIVTTTGPVRTMHWTVNGVDFVLTGALPPQEMLKMAFSTWGMTGK